MTDQPFPTFSQAVAKITDLNFKHNRLMSAKCELKTMGISTIIELSEPALVVPLDASPKDLAKHINGQWDQVIPLEHKNNSGHDFVSYSVEFLRGDVRCNIRAKKIQLIPT